LAVKKIKKAGRTERIQGGVKFIIFSCGLKVGNYKKQTGCGGRHTEIQNNHVNLLRKEDLKKITPWAEKMWKPPVP